MPKYKKPDALIRWVINPTVLRLTKLGLSVRGSAVLSVRGRKTGQWRSTPVNPLRVGDERYLVGPHGEAQWVRNLRAAGEGRLQVGRKVTAIKVTDVPDSEKVPIIREYLEHWGRDTGRFFEVKGGANASDDEIARVAPENPVFRITHETPKG